MAAPPPIPAVSAATFFYNKNKPESYHSLGEGWSEEFGEKFPTWSIGTMKNGTEDLLVVSIPNLGFKNDYDSWKGFLLLALLSIALGVVMILNPFGTMETLVMAIGVILIVEGAINLLSALYTVLAVRRFAKLHPETQSVLESITGEDLNGDGVVAPDVTRTDAEATAVELDHVDESATVEQEKRE